MPRSVPRTLYGGRAAGRENSCTLTPRIWRVVDSGNAGRRFGELDPVGLTHVRKVPDFVGAVQQQIKADIDEVRHISRRESSLLRNDERPAAAQAVQRSRQELASSHGPKNVLVRMIKGSGAASSIACSAFALLSPYTLSGETGLPSRYGARERPSKTRSDENATERNVVPGTNLRDVDGAVQILAKAALAIGFGVVYPDVACRIDDGPWLQLLDRIDHLPFVDDIEITRVNAT